jgi:hypothetical protein
MHGMSVAMSLSGSITIKVGSWQADTQLQTLPLARLERIPDADESFGEDLPPYLAHLEESLAELQSKAKDWGL